MNARRRHIYITGFMGTGKSTVGAMLAERLGLPFVDLDDVIVTRQGRSIVDIFRDEGESVFRRYESAALEEAAAGPRSVIALGGGVPTVPKNADLIRATGRAILLTADWHSLWQRISRAGNRPLLHPVFAGAKGVRDVGAFTAHVQPILQQRRAAYEAIADFTIDTSQLSPGEVTNQVVTWLTQTESPS